MNKLDANKRELIVKALIDGVGVNATCRLSGAAKHTVLKLLRELGEACAEYHSTHVRGLQSRKVQCDEIWSFVYLKQKNVPAEKQGQFGYGDIWTWTAIDPQSKIIISYMLGLRDADYATEFMNDVASRLTKRVQLSTDGLKAYLIAVDEVFGGAVGVDYAQLIKIYGTERAGEARYSPAKVIGIEDRHVCGMPDDRHISTSHVERQNLTMRMGMRRFTRLTNAHSKKVENHAHMLALYFMHYNFCKVHSTIRVTPAMEAGIADHVWEIEELLGIL
jgi:IS1 family transposase